ncbi:hypothetical protein KIN20_021828 [Parelaphostrongylus tenuis]|uniref:Uncharacterized protein n=1 Tax=Parelaphostrongylus tenuis TaxID=148309 RepID=A0AAD5QRU1_PARTN|nr:hypothetical protein KIN20_021828 [Parelaphostrongylus tenuis]
MMAYFNDIAFVKEWAETTKDNQQLALCSGCQLSKLWMSYEELRMACNAALPEILSKRGDVGRHL